MIKLVITNFLSLTVYSLDQTLGKPGQYTSEKNGQPMTIGARLTRVELQVNLI